MFERCYSVSDAFQEADAVARVKVGDWQGGGPAQLGHVLLTRPFRSPTRGDLPRNFTLVQGGCSEATSPDYPLFTSGTELLVFLRDYDGSGENITPSPTITRCCMSYDEAGGRYFPGQLRHHERPGHLRSRQDHAGQRTACGNDGGCRSGAGRGDFLPGQGLRRRLLRLRGIRPGGLFLRSDKAIRLDGDRTPSRRIKSTRPPDLRQVGFYSYRLKEPGTRRTPLIPGCQKRLAEFASRRPRIVFNPFFAAAPQGDFRWAWTSRKILARRECVSRIFCVKTHGSELEISFCPKKATPFFDKLLLPQDPGLQGAAVGVVHPQARRHVDLGAAARISATDVSMPLLPLVQKGRMVFPVRS